jgi:hypothetical protein
LRWEGNLARKGKIRNIHRFLVRKPETMRQLGRNRHRWEDNINTKLKEIG